MIFQYPRAQYAQGPQRLNYGHPVTQNLGFCWHGPSRLNLVTNQGFSSRGSELSYRGLQIVSTDAKNIVNAANEPATANFLYSQTRYSMLAIANPGTLGNRRALFELPADRMTVAQGYSDSSAVFAYITDTDFVAETASGFFVSGECAVFGYTFDGARNPHAKFFKNGSEKGSGNSSGGTTTASISDMNDLCIGGDGSGGNVAQWDGSIELLALWNRCLSDAEAIALTANPYQLFTPPRRWWVEPPSGVVQTTYNRRPFASPLFQSRVIQ